MSDMGASQRLLILGDPSSLWTKRYIEHVALKSGMKVSLLNAEGSSFGAYYSENGVSSFDLGLERLAGRSGKIGIALGLLSVVKDALRSEDRLSEFEFIHMHYLGPLNSILAPIIKRMSPNAHLIGSFWGSDLLRPSSFERILMRRSIQYFDAITVQDRKTMIEPLERELGSQVDGKLWKVLFPGSNTNLGVIEEGESEEESRGHLGLPSDKIIVAVGYNASPAQQHLPVLEVLPALPADVQRTIHVLLPLTGIEPDESYRHQIDALVSRLDCDCTVIEGFQTEDDIARIRRVSDIMIHAQISDAASASVIEFLKARTALLNPAWIPYCEMRERGVSYVEYAQFQDIPGLLQQLLNGNISIDVERNRHLLRDYDSIDAELAEGWLNVYRGLQLD